MIIDCESPNEAVFSKVYCWQIHVSGSKLSEKRELRRRFVARGGFGPNGLFLGDSVITDGIIDFETQTITLRVGRKTFYYF